MRILGISGSLRRDSHNTALLRAAAELLPPGAQLELFDDLKAIPPYDADDDEPELHGPERDLRHLEVARAELSVAHPSTLSASVGFMPQLNANGIVSRVPVELPAAL